MAKNYYTPKIEQPPPLKIGQAARPQKERRKSLPPIIFQSEHVSFRLLPQYTPIYKSVESPFFDPITIDPITSNGGTFKWNSRGFLWTNQINGVSWFP